MFGSLLPDNVQFYMRNGNMYHGTCSKKDRKMIGLSDLIADYGLSTNEKLLLTYFGGGNFFLMVFDSDFVEAMMLSNLSEDTCMSV